MFDVLDKCLCDAGQSVSFPSSSIPESSLISLEMKRCPSENDRKRLECIKNPYGPDDGIRSECLEFLKGDMEDYRKI
jgi:hypothetical protein